jgi:hypothetical protein
MGLVTLVRNRKLPEISLGHGPQVQGNTDLHLSRSRDAEVARSTAGLTYIYIHLPLLFPKFYSSGSYIISVVVDNISGTYVRGMVRP